MDFADRATSHARDPLTGRLASTDLPSLPGLENITHAYYGDGTRKQVTDEHGTTTFSERDERGQVERIERPDLPALVHDHDTSGHRTVTAVDDGTPEQVTYAWDGAGRMTAVVDPQDGTRADYGWDDAGRLETITYSGCGGPEVVGTHDYDALSGALRSILWERILSPTASEPLLLLEYELDDGQEGPGRRTGVTERNRWLFAGEERVEGIGLDYLRARWMEPGVGRFASRDAFEGARRLPGSRNLLVYVASAPLEAVDPSGHESVPQMVAASGMSLGAQAMFSAALILHFWLANEELKDDALERELESLQLRFGAFECLDLANAAEAAVKRHRRQKKWQRITFVYTPMGEQMLAPMIQATTGVLAGEPIGRDEHHGILKRAEQIVYDTNPPPMPRSVWENGAYIVVLRGRDIELTFRLAENLNLGVINTTDIE